MRRLLVVLALAALVAPPVALAHGSISPTATAAGAADSFVVTIPGAAGGARVVAISVTAPTGVTIESAVPREPRWRVRVRGQTVRWQGGPLRDAGEQFGFSARMPEAEGTYTFTGREGGGLPFPLAVTVTRSDEPTGATVPSSSPTSSDGGTPAWVGVALAGPILLLLVGGAAAGLVAFRRIRASRK